MEVFLHLLKSGDQDDIMIERCKYQTELNENKEFSSMLNILEQRERIFYD